MGYTRADMGGPIVQGIKFAPGSEVIIEGMGLPFGGPFGGKDLHGTYFSARTDFALDLYPAGTRPIMYDHGLDDALRAAPAGRVLSYEPSEEGIWTRGELDRHAKYLASIQELIHKSALGWSSGAMPHLIEVDRKTGHIDRWPVVEQSLTPIPANPDAMVAYAVKSADFVEHLRSVGAGDPEALIAQAEAYIASHPLTEDAAPGRQTFADQSDRVLGEIRSLVVRSDALAQLRAQARGADDGRVLSDANRERLIALRNELDGLIRSTEQREDASVLLDAYLLDEARRLGVAV